MLKFPALFPLIGLLLVLLLPAARGYGAEARFAYTTAVPVSLVIADESGKTLQSFREDRINGIQWSPDGSSLLFKSEIWHPEEGEMDGFFLLPAESSSPVATAFYGYINYAAWYPDGRSFLLDEGLDLFSVSTDGVKSDKICPYDKTKIRLWRPLPSPDGKSLLGLARPVGMDRGEQDLFLTGPRCESPRRLTDEKTNFHIFSWAPDGKRIAFVKNGAIVVVDVEGKRRQEITEAKRYFGLDWTDDGRILTSWDDGLKTEGTNKIGIVDPAGGKTVVLLEHADPPATVLSWRPRMKKAAAK